MTALALRPLALRSVAILAASASVAFAAGCGGSDSNSGGSSSGGSSSGGSDSGGQITATTGKDIFNKAGCISCHTLADAGSTGSIGPNLDKEKPGEDEIIEKVTNGDGRMPSFKDQLSAEQIKTVATYIASVEGK